MPLMSLIHTSRLSLGSGDAEASTVKDARRREGLQRHLARTPATDSVTSSPPTRRHERENAMRVFCLKAASPLAILALAGLAACGSSSSGDATPPISQGISIALSGSSIGVQQGQSNTMSVTVTRTGGFTGAVSLSLESAPTGVTGAFTPQSLTGT